jgi:hypothetical protein
VSINEENELFLRMPSKYDKIWTAAAEAEEELIREHDED